MISSEAAYSADVYSDQLTNSSPYESVLSSSYPHFPIYSGEYYYNYLDENCYNATGTSVDYGQNFFVDYYPETYESIVPVNDHYQAFYNDSPVFEEIPVVIYYVPLVYYTPVYLVPAYTSYDVNSQYYVEAHDLCHSNTFEYPTSEISDDNLGKYSAPQTVSEECTTLDFYYEEADDHLNDAPFHDEDDDDEKKINEDNESLKSDSEGSSSEFSSSDESACDKRERNAITRFGNYWDLSHLVEGNRSDHRKSSEDDGSDDDDELDMHPAVPYCRKSICYNSEVRLKSGVDDSDEESFSVHECDLDKNEDIVINRCEDFLDICKPDDDNSRSQKNSQSSNIENMHQVIPGELKEIAKSKSQRLKEHIMASKEFNDIQENLEHSEHYKQWLYKLSLKKNPRRNDDVLLHFLPTLTEEPVVPVLEDNQNVEEVSVDSYEIVSIDNDDDSKKECKQQKKRFKSVKKFLSKIFCCCMKKPPPYVLNKDGLLVGVKFFHRHNEPPLTPNRYIKNSC